MSFFAPPNCAAQTQGLSDKPSAHFTFSSDGGTDIPCLSLFVQRGKYLHWSALLSRAPPPLGTDHALPGDYGFFFLTPWY